MKPWNLQNVRRKNDIVWTDKSNGYTRWVGQRLVSLRGGYGIGRTTSDYWEAIFHKVKGSGERGVLAVQHGHMMEKELRIPFMRVV